MNQLGRAWLVIAALACVPALAVGCGDDDGGGVGGGTGGGDGGGVGGGTGGGVGGGTGGGTGGGNGDAGVGGGNGDAGTGGGGGDVTAAFCGSITATSCSCFGTTCQVMCAAGECQATTLVCPAGFDCNITCTGNASCDSVTLDCETNDTDCGVACGSGQTCDALMYTCDDTNGTNCCACSDDSAAFACPVGTGPASCDAPAPVP